MTKQSRVGLTPEQKAALLQRMSIGHATGDKKIEMEASPRSWTDFSTLPRYQELAMQRSLARALNLENPFFRVHDRRAAAETVISGREYINYASYDYLGFNGRSELAAAATAAIARYGTSSSASRVVAGERPVHRELESALALIYRAEDCVVMVSGHGTNVTTIGSILGPRDLLVHDALIHNSVLVGAKLAGAERRSFPHNDLGELDRLLTRIRGQYERVLLVVEGLYSMDGDFPDLPRLIAIKKRHDAWLMVDEAHALGVLGPKGYGLADHFGVDPREVDLWMGTLSKTLASCGGYIAGRGTLIEYLKCTADGFVYSVGMSPPLAASALAALDLLAAGQDMVKQLKGNGSLFVELARSKGFDVGSSCGSAIVPIMVGDSLKAVALADKLYARGINVLPIIHPAVPERSARLRFFLTASHTAEQISESIDILAQVGSYLLTRKRTDNG